jgi:hypothetical protein
MSTKDMQAKFSLLGTWKLKLSAKDINYSFPETIAFSSAHNYSVSGKEDRFHPILDGGWYEYNANSKELKINTANDAIKKYSIKEKKDGFSLLENNKMMAEYIKDSAR